MKDLCFRASHVVNWWKIQKLIKGYILNTRLVRHLLKQTNIVYNIEHNFKVLRETRRIFLYKKQVIDIVMNIDLKFVKILIAKLSIMTRSDLFLLKLVKYYMNYVKLNYSDSHRVCFSLNDETRCSFDHYVHA